MATVYWSPWYSHEELYASLHLLYEEPDSLFQSIKPNQNKQSKGDNWYQCHAFLNSIKNTFVLRFPHEMSFGIDPNFGIVKVTDIDWQLLNFAHMKQPSVENAYTFSIVNNWIFWSDESLQITTTPAYLHKTPYDGFYVPGSFNINSWFRPLEAAIQLHQGASVVNIKGGDPMAYIKFHTDESITFKRFYLTKEIEKLSNDCIGYKRHNPNRGLNYLYSKFKSHGLDKVISREIHKNLMN